jgi:hypothetical protein
MEESCKGLLEPLVYLPAEVCGISGNDARLVWGARRLFEIIEADFGWLWTSYRSQDDSEAMVALVRRYEALVAIIGVGSPSELRAGRVP